jgi:hypothetical protein
MGKIFEALQHAQTECLQLHKLLNTDAQPSPSLPGHAELEDIQEDVRLKIKHISAALDLIPPVRGSRNNHIASRDDHTKAG